MTVATEHQKLYDRIPSFECKIGCTDCCGPVTFSRFEWSKITDKRVATCLDCPYSGKGSCAIYKDRPMICRIFGTVDHDLLRCPHGCAPEELLSKAEADDIMAQYLKLEDS